MKKYILRILIIVALVGIVAPIFANAQTQTPAPTEYKLLAPLPCPEGSTGCTGKSFIIKDGALGNYINLIIELVIGISAVLAVVMIAMGGIEYMGSELISDKEEGRERIQNALIGLLIAMGAFALLNTINPDLLKSDVTIKPAVVTVQLNDSVPQTPINGKYINGASVDAPWTGTPTTLPNKVTLNNNGKQCTRIGEKGCTSTIGLNMVGVLDIQSKCPQCKLQITGGTEWWEHGAKTGNTTHQKGNATVDLSTSDKALNDYFRSGESLGNGWYKTAAGYALYEGNHWHFNPVSKN